MAKTIVTAMLFTAVGIGLSACFEEPRDGSHGPGYKAAGWTLGLSSRTISGPTSRHIRPPTETLVPA
jgi:hypothetical protein